MIEEFFRELSQSFNQPEVLGLDIISSPVLDLSSSTHWHAITEKEFEQWNLVNYWSAERIEVCRERQINFSPKALKMLRDS